jgi:hypothetical protein
MAVYGRRAFVTGELAIGVRHLLHDCARILGLRRAAAEQRQRGQ